VAVPDFRFIGDDDTEDEEDEEQEAEEAEEDDAPPASQVPPPTPPSPPPQPAAAAAGRRRAGDKTPKLAQDTAMHEHLQKPVDPRRLASSKVHTVTMPLLAQS
jgi:hypothetical protein